MKGTPEECHSSTSLGALSGFGGRIYGLNASSGLPPQKAYDWNGSFVPKIGRD